MFVDFWAGIFKWIAKYFYLQILYLLSKGLKTTSIWKGTNWTERSFRENHE